MNPKTIAITGIIAVVVLAAAAALTISQRGETRTSPVAGIGEPFLPQLREKLNDVARVELADTGATLTFVREGEEWVLEEKGGYTVQFRRVRDLVMNLSRMNLLEPKTANPNLYAQINVDDITEDGSRAKQIRLYDSAGNEIAGAILGRLHYGPGARGDSGNQFVRRLGESQSWLVDGTVSTTTSERSWLDTELLDIASERIQRVSISHPDGDTVEAVRETPDGQLELATGIPEGRELRAANTVQTTLSGILRSLRFDDVKRPDALPLDEAEPVLTAVETFDGLQVTAQVHELDDRRWVSFKAAALEDKIASINEERLAGQAAGDEDDGEESGEVAEPIDLEAIRTEAEEINRRYGRWIYALPAHITDRMQKRVEDFLAPLPEDDGEEAAAAEDDDDMPSFSLDEILGPGVEIPPELEQQFEQ